MPTPGRTSSRQNLTNNADARSVEGQVASPEVHTALHRQLEKRHVTMISIGSVIGTGLFIRTALALMDGGPLGLLLSYIFIGSICYATMISLCEMIVLLPLPGGFIKLAERFVDPAFAFAIGWNYWYQWTLSLPAELSAAATVIRYWDPKTNPALWISICLVVAIGINALGVGAYGETEFWFSSIKVLTITGVIVLGIIIDLGGGPNHDHIGFRYWKDPGPFATYGRLIGPKGHFLGTCRATAQVMFAYVGTEAVAMAAAEARNPRRNIPKAIRTVYFRILFLYIGSVFVVGLLVPSSTPSLNIDSESGNASASPFVIAIETAGIKTLPSIINAAILTSAWSAGSSDLYLSSRSLYGLAVSGSAPKILSRTTRSGLPYVAVGICSCFALLAYLGIGDGTGIVFSWFSGFASAAGLVTWFAIGVTYLRFYQGMKAQGIARKTLPFSSRMQPFAGWWCVCGSAFILIFSAWDVFLEKNWNTTRFVTNYIPIVLFPTLYLTAKLVMRTSSARLDKLDFESNVAEFDAMTYDERPPRNIFEAFWMWLIWTRAIMNDPVSALLAGG